MKKSIMLCLVSLCASLLYAQSSNAKFIDSPSWVLQGEGQVAAAPVATKAPASGATKAPASVSAPAKTTTASTASKSSTGSKSVAGSKSAPAAVVKGPQQEGFLHIGVYVMPAINWVGNVSDGYKRDGVTGMVTPTIMVDMRIIRRLFGGVGISFNTLGGRLSAQGTEDLRQHTSSYNFSYIEIPFRLKLKTPNFGESKGSLFLSAGASVGFGVNYKYKDVYENISLPTQFGNKEGTLTVTGKMKKDAKLANFSIIGQLGYNYQIVKHFNLIVGVEYRYACVDPIKDNRKFNLKDLAFHNHQIGLMLGIMF